MKPSKRALSFEVLLVLFTLGVHLYAAFSDAYNFPNAWFMRDDAYYYFKVAQNIANGAGSTFDGINLTNGYHPLWLVVCIPIFWLTRHDLILPLRILLVGIGALNAATAVLLYRLIKANLSQPVAALAASFWSYSILIFNTVYQPGLETPLAAFFIVLLLFQLSRIERERRPVSSRQMILLALLGSLAMFSRLDLVFLVTLIGTWLVFRGSPLRFLLPLDILIIYGSLTSAVALRTGIPAYNASYAGTAQQVVVVFLLTKVLAMFFFGAYRHPRSLPLLMTIRQTFFGLSLGTLVGIMLHLLLIQCNIGTAFPRSAYLIDWVISLVLMLGLRFLMIWFGAPNVHSPSTPGGLNELRTRWKRWATSAGIYFGIVGGSLGLYMLYNRLTFGAWSPVSGQVKRWWGTMLNTVYESPASNWMSFLGINLGGTYDTLHPASNLFWGLQKMLTPFYPGSVRADERAYMVMAIFVLASLAILMINKKKSRRVFINMAILPLSAACGVQTLSYTTSAYGGAKEWYWISQMILVLLLASILVDFMLCPLQRSKPVRAGMQIGAAALGILLAIQFAANIAVAMPHGRYPDNKPYMDVISFLEENTRPGTVIGLSGGGNVGYFIKDRTIVNMDGLINSYEYFQALKNGKAAGYLQLHGVQVVFASPKLLGYAPYNGQFDAYFEKYSQYGGKNLMYLLKDAKY